MTVVFLLACLRFLQLPSDHDGRPLIKGAAALRRLESRVGRERFPESDFFQRLSALVVGLEGGRVHWEGGRIRRREEGG